jgi:hypothetical protein
MLPEPKNPITLGELIKTLVEKGEDGKSLSDRMQEIADENGKDADVFWDGLSYEDKLKAFYSVCKRIHKGDVVERGSYRHVLYDTFGFGFDAYAMGMDCGYMNIHNFIVTPDEQKSINEQHKIAQYIVESEPFTWLMVGSNHVDMQIASLREAYKKWSEAGGTNELKKEQ